MPSIRLTNKGHAKFGEWEKTFVLNDDQTVMRSIVKLNATLQVPSDDGELDTFLGQLVDPRVQLRASGSRDYDLHAEASPSTWLAREITLAGLPSSTAHYTAGLYAYRFCHVGVAVNYNAKQNKRKASNVEIKFTSEPLVGGGMYGSNSLILNLHLEALTRRSISNAKRGLASKMQEFSRAFSAAATFFDRVDLRESAANEGFVHVTADDRAYSAWKRASSNP